MTPHKILTSLHALANVEHIASMNKLGASVDRCRDARLGVSIRSLRRLAKNIPRSRCLASQMWKELYIEAKQISCLIDEPSKIDKTSLEKQVQDIETWDLCDLFCQELVARSRFADELAFSWTTKQDPIVSRAGWVCCAQLAIHRPTEWKRKVPKFIRQVSNWSGGSNALTKKAVSWAMRETGKRIDGAANDIVTLANDLIESNDASQRWVGRDVLRELKPKTNHG